MSRQRSASDQAPVSVNVGAGINPYDADIEPEQSEAWFRAYGQQDKFYWQPKRRGKTVKRMATIDCETDPFSGPGNPVRPFCWGFYNGSTYHQFWGTDATAELLAHIKSLDYPHVIYAHNGGKFDFTFMLDAIEPEVFCIGTRIVKALIIGESGIEHEIRDSFSIIPEALDFASEKTVIDYGIMAKTKRDKHKAEILAYLKDDCTLLYKYVETFRKEFGNVLTMASASMAKLNLSMKGRSRKGKTLQCYERLTEAQDAELRPYYYGGHVECFKRGVFEAPSDEPFVLVDINSSYANVMRNMLHPISAGYVKGLREITSKTDFALIDATSKGALPIRDQKTKELLFPHGRFLFQATGHEIRMALQLGLLTIHRLHDAWEAYERVSFADFIDHYYRVRLEAKAKGEAIYALFWKRIMNGAYGKFAQNPRKFKDTMICRPNDEAPDSSWSLAERYELMDIYTRQSDQQRAWRSYLNVGTGASITGGARAELLRGISQAEGVLYCDTDSIICKRFNGLSDASQLGAWKVETSAHTVAIADKKMYALWGAATGGTEGDKRFKAYGDTACVKLASKGVRATAADIMALARGQTVEFVPLAPTIKLDGSQVWTNRRLKRRDMLPGELILSQRSLEFATD